MKRACLKMNLRRSEMQDLTVNIAPSLWKFPGDDILDRLSNTLLAAAPTKGSRTIGILLSPYDRCASRRTCLSGTCAERSRIESRQMHGKGIPRLVSREGEEKGRVEFAARRGVTQDNAAGCCQNGQRRLSFCIHYALAHRARERLPSSRAVNSFLAPARERALRQYIVRFKCKRRLRSRTTKSGTNGSL